MKKLLTMLCVAAAALFATSCYDDSALRESIEEHEQRISALEQLTKEMNTNISSLAQLVETLQKGGGVASVVEIREAGEVIGYAVTLTDGSTVTIYGNETSDLLDGASAVIGVKAGADGTYYWTVNGEWMLDEEGNKVAAASAADSGASGITPQLKIEDDFWYVSYDNGKNWEKLGKAVAESSCIFKNVTKTEEAVIFELVDGTVLTLPLGNAFRIIFDNVPSAPIEAGQTVEISYSIEGLVGDADIFIIADDACFDTELVQETASTGKILVALCCDSDSDSEIKGKIALFALSESGLTVGKSLDLVSGVFRISEHGADLYTIGSKACQLELPIRTNVDFAVEVYADWLTYVETKAVEEKTLVFDVQENSGVARREAVVRVYTDQSSLYFTIVQESHAADFNLSFTWDETASYGMAEIDFSVLTDAYGNTLASVLGYDSWDDVRMAIGDYDTYRAFAGEVVVTGYDPNTGDSFGYLDYTSNAIGYWLDAYGQPSMWGTDEARTYWEFFADAEEDVYSRCGIGVMPGNISVGDVYKQGYMFKSPYGVAKVEVTITIEAFVDPEIGLYPEDATPGIFDIEVSQNLDLSKQTYEFEGIRTSETFDEVKTLLGMTSYELYTSINAGYIMSDDGSLYSGLRREVILPDGTTVDAGSVLVKADNSYADWGDDVAMIMEWTYGHKSDDYSFFFCPYPTWSETGWFFSDEVKAMIGKTMTATFRITYIPSDENGVPTSPTIINMNCSVSVSDSSQVADPVSELLKALDSGVQEIELEPLTYDFTSVQDDRFLSGVLTLSSSMTLKGTDNGSASTKIIGGFKLNDSVGSFELVDVELDGMETISNLLTVSGATRVESISIKDCDIRGYGGRIVYIGDEDVYVSNLTLSGVLVDKIGVMGDCVDIRKGTCTQVIVDDCTFSNGIRSFLRIDSVVECSSVKITNNTFYNICFADSKDNNGVFHVRAECSYFEASKNVFASMHSLDGAPSDSMGRGFPKLLSPNSLSRIPSFSKNLFYDVDIDDPLTSWFSAGARVNSDPSVTEDDIRAAAIANGGEILSESPFTGTPTSGDFSIKSEYKGIGASIWF